ncbi:MAG: hypothetical protein IDH49_04085 [Gammaproteobacteria bacterium]|nr:hypothetical protein [Gammaproteobacteria bacterium]
MQQFAAFIMRGRIQAMLVAALFGILSLVLPVLQPLATVVSGAVVALVALRLGAREGMFVILGAALGVAVAAALMLGNPMPALLMGLVLWIPVWGMALLLRSSVSLALSFQVAALLGGLIIVAVYLLLPDPAAWWREKWDTLMIPAMQQAGMGDAEQLRQALAPVVSRMTGALATAQAVTLLCSLMVGRWWQALLYNPGGFGREFRDLRLGGALAYSGIAVLGLAFFASGAMGGIARDVLLILVALYMFQGLALAHAVAAGRHAAWLMALYTLMAIALPFAAVALAGVGFADHWLNIRSRFGAGGTPPGGAPPRDESDVRRDV